MKITFRVPKEDNILLNIGEYVTDRHRDIRLLVTEALLYCRKDLDYYDKYLMEIDIETLEEEKYIEEIRSFIKNIGNELKNEIKLSNVKLFIIRRAK